MLKRAQSEIVNIVFFIFCLKLKSRDYQLFKYGLRVVLAAFRDSRKAMQYNKADFLDPPCLDFQELFQSPRYLE